MEAEATPTVGGEEEPDPAPARSLWVIPVGILAIVVVFAATGIRPAPELDPDDEITPPVLDLAEIAWTRAAGVEGLQELGGVAHFDGAWWLVGSDATSLAVWRNPGRPGLDRWELVTRIPGSTADLHNISQVTLAGARLVVVDQGRIHSSSDGVEWVEHPLPPIDDSLSHAHTVVDTPTGITVIGWSEPDHADQRDRAMAELSEGSRRLVEDGLAELSLWRNRATVWIHPGLAVEEVSLADLDQDPVEFRWSRAVWHGPDLDTLEARHTDGLYVSGIARSPDGVLIANTGARLVLSTDARTWTSRPQPDFQSIHWFAPFGEGAIVIGDPHRIPVRWDGDSDTAEPVLPYHPYPVPGVVYRSPVTSDLGVALLANRLDLTGATPRRVHVANQGDIDVYLTDSYDIVIASETGPEVVAIPWQVSVSMVDDDLLRIEVQEGSVIHVPIRTWIDRVRQIDSLASERVEESYLLYSPDGNTWSHVAWSGVVGGPVTRGPSLFATDTFLVALHHPQDFDQEAQVWIGVRSE